MNTKDKSILDFEDPGMLPKELMDMPDFVNELKNYTLQTGQRMKDFPCLILYQKSIQI